MRRKQLLATVLLTILPALLVGAGEAGSPTTEEQLAFLQKMCTDSEQARAQRHAEEALFNRLGGYDRIHALTREIVRLHNGNPAIQHLFAGVDSESLAKHVADFVATGTGGPETYTGRAMPAAHAHLDLTDADFLSAGGDVAKAMQNLGHGQEEIDEIVCILVSLKDQVVLSSPEPGVGSSQ
jgi:hemoglobin